MAVDFSAEVGDLDHYAAAPDTLAVVAASPDSLARVVGGDIFGHYWSSFGGNGQITAIDGVSMTGRADGVQELATATYSTFKGVEAAIASVGSDQSNWLQLIYGTLQQQGDLGTVYTRLLEVLNLLKESERNSVGGVRYAVGSRVGFTVPDLLADISWNQTQLGYSTGRYLSWFGGETSGNHVFANTLDSGFLGLARLLFGDTSHSIYGLSYTGDDKEGARGSWSLADITANGMRGLATLLAGSDAHRKDGYVWLNQSGYEGNGSISLMDMVGEGFLGLSSFFSVSEQGVPRLSWMYVSLDDGLTGTQLKHDTLFSFLGSFASGVQNPLARLAYVLADLEDIEFKKEEKPNMDEVKDSFFGDGEGAVDTGQIKDVGGMSSSIKDSFGGAGSPGDAFTAINDSQSFWFFSQEVADALDTVNVAAPASEEEDDFMDQFVQDDDGFYSLIDLSPWDVSLYLGGER